MIETMTEAITTAVSGTACAEAPAPAPALTPPLALNSQYLVWPGHKGVPQRVYLIRLAGPFETPIGVDPLQRWQQAGVLPVTVFKRLTQDWIDGGHTAATGNGAAPAGRGYKVNVGLTFSGLQQLDLDAQLLDILRKKSPAFAQGAYPRAMRMLGDSGPSDATQWEAAYHGERLHVALFVFAASAETAVADFVAFERHVALCVDAKAVAATVAAGDLLKAPWIEQSMHLGGRGEIHFGMRDGVSDLHFENADHRRLSGDSRDYNAHAWGELLLGHEKNDHSNPWAVPGAYATPGALRDLTTVPERVRYGQFFQDASFGAFRKMAQNTQAFDDYLSRQAARVQGTATGGEMTAYVKSWVKAKMLGRWENGEVVRPEHGLPAQRGYLTDAERARMSLTAPVAPATSATQATEPTASKDNKDNKDLNAFSFADDKAALGCPFGAHIRRMNPRQDPVVPFLRRPLVRRGLPYGGPDDAEKGLLGLFLCSSLEEQFEHLLGNWADNNPMGTPLQWAGKDPVIGNHERYGGRFEVPMADAGALAFDTMPVFVETRGTAYLLFPALHALRQIAEGPTGTQG